MPKAQVACPSFAHAGAVSSALEHDPGEAQRVLGRMPDGRRYSESVLPRPCDAHAKKAEHSRREQRRADDVNDAQTCRVANSEDDPSCKRRPDADGTQ